MDACLANGWLLNSQMVELWVDGGVYGVLNYTSHSNASVSSQRM